jgi:hypothetical protein
VDQILVEAPADRQPTNLGKSTGGCDAAAPEFFHKEASFAQGVASPHPLPDPFRSGSRWRAGAKLLRLWSIS